MTCRKYSLPHLMLRGQGGTPHATAGLLIILLIGMRTQKNAALERKINKHYLLPALEVARKAGLIVIHSQPGFISHKYSQYKALVAEMTGTEIQPVMKTPPIPKYTREEMAKWTVKNWPGWSMMDFPVALVSGG